MKKTREKKQEPAVEDASCWYITNSRKENGYCPVENEAGDPVELNTPQTAEDMKAWDNLHMEQRYGEVWPMLYECVVFGHNLRNGHFPRTLPIPTNTTEATYIVRVEFNRGGAFFHK